jgi:hypothetical protein
MPRNPGDSPLWKSIAIVTTFVMSVALNIGSFAYWVLAPDSLAMTEPPAPELVVVLDETGKRITDAGIEKIAGTLPPGRWTAQGVPKPGNAGWVRSVVVTELDKPLPPKPEPPKPEPPKPEPPKPEPPAPAYPAPSPELQTAVAGVRAVAPSNKPAADFLAQSHAIFASQLRAMPGRIKSSGQLKQDLQAFLAGLYVKNSSLGQLPGFSAAVESAFDRAFGEADAPVTDQRAIDFCSALAWALGG